MVKRFDVWLANLNPQKGTEPGKTRPVIVVQTNLLNESHPSTIICPITSNVILEANLLRVHLKKGEAGLDQDSDILIDHIRAIDNTRFKKYLGKVSPSSQKVIINNLKVVLDLGW